MKKILLILVCFMLALNTLTAYAREISDVPVINQYPELPTGCEAAATAMLLQWTGVDVSKIEIADLLPKTSVPYFEEDTMHAGNSNKGFVGDPFSESGFGVFHKPIAEIINSYTNNNALDITGISFEELMSIIDSGRPVVVWSTFNMEEAYVGCVWYDDDGDEVDWILPEHCMLLVGYNDEEVIVNDPYDGERRTFPIDVFKNNWEVMGSQAVTILNY